MSIIIFTVTSVKGMHNVCVCLCVCVRESERERERERERGRERERERERHYNMIIVCVCVCVCVCACMQSCGQTPPLLISDGQENSMCVHMCVHRPSGC